MARSASLMGATPKLIRSVTTKLNFWDAVRYSKDVVSTCVLITRMLTRVAAVPLIIVAPARNVMITCRKPAARTDATTSFCGS